MSPAICCHFRSTARRGSCTTTRTCPEGGAAAIKLRSAGAVCGFTTSWPSWINVENFSAFHDLPMSTKANGFDGLDAQLNFNNPLMERHIAQLAEWQTTKMFDY